MCSPDPDFFHHKIRQMATYQLLFKGQSIDDKTRYEVVRETKDYLFLKEIRKEPSFIFRVHVRTLNVKGIKEGKNGYRWDAPSAVRLTKMD